MKYAKIEQNRTFIVLPHKKHRVFIKKSSKVVYFSGIGRFVEEKRPFVE